jgi:hypothetical protein
MIPNKIWLIPGPTQHTHSAEFGEVLQKVQHRDITVLRLTWLPHILQPDTTMVEMFPRFKNLSRRQMLASQMNL